MNFNTLQEAQQYTDTENMGRDYSTAVVRKVDNYYIVIFI